MTKFTKYEPEEESEMNPNLYVRTYAKDYQKILHSKFLCENACFAYKDETDELVFFIQYNRKTSEVEDILIYQRIILELYLADKTICSEMIDVEQGIIEINFKNIMDVEYFLSGGKPKINLKKVNK